MNLFALDERVGRVLDHLVAGAEAGDDLHVGAVVFADDHRNQMRDVAVDHGAHAQAFLAEDERGGGHDEGGAGGRRLEVDLGQRAGQQLAGAVVHVDLHQQRAAGRIDGVGGADQRSLVDFAGVLGKGQVDLRAALHVLRVDLRQVGVDAQGLDGLHVEEFLARAGVDQLAGIDVAGGDHAVKGRVDLLEGLQFA